MKKIVYGISAIFLLLLSFSSISRADGGLDQFVENFSQYRIVHYSPRKWYEYCDITGVHKEGKDVIIKFKFRGNDTRLTLDKPVPDQENARAGSFPSKGWITSIVDVQLKFNADGTANGKWKDLGLKGSFHILKKGVVLRAALDKLVNNFNRYKIAITPLTGGQKLCNILNIHKEEDGGIVIKFEYRGKTRLIIDKFNDDLAVAYGKYIREVVGVDIVVPVELIFKADGTAVGTWKRGIGNEFNIVRQPLSSYKVKPNVRPPIRSLNSKE